MIFILPLPHINIKNINSIAILFIISVFHLLLRVFEIYNISPNIISILDAFAFSIIPTAIFYFFQTYIPSLKIRRVAIQELNRILAQYTSMFTDIYFTVSTKEELDDFHYKEPSKLLSVESSIKISSNLHTNQMANIYPPQAYKVHLANKANTSKEKINTIIMKYAHYLPSDLITDLNTLQDNPFFAVCENLQNMESLGYTQLPQNILIDFFNQMLTLTNHYELDLSRHITDHNINHGLVGKNLNN